MNNPRFSTVLWSDAAYTYEKELPKGFPNPRLTIGVIVSNNEEFVFIATNVDFDKVTGNIKPVDGFVIPKKTVLELKEVN